MSSDVGFIANQPIVMADGTPVQWFRDFQFVVDRSIRDAGLVSVWGNISGTLSNQTDLQTALDGKATSAQGALADSAVQPADNVSILTNDANYRSTGDNVSLFTNDAGYITGYVPPTVRNESSTSYTMVIGDANQVTRFTGTSPSVTIPQESSVNYPTGTELRIRQAGAGTLVLTTTGLTINGSLPTWAQHVELLLRKVGSDEWDAV